MSILNFEEPKRSQKTAWILAFLLFGIAVSYFGLKTTLAANVSINSGSQVEFGQGIAQTTSCSGSQSIIITPMSSFTNSGGSSGSFKFSSFKVSNIPSSCYGFDFTISAYDSVTGTSPLGIFNTSSTAATIYDNSGSFSTGINGVGLTTSTISSNSFSASFDLPVSSASAIYKITIQSSLHAPIPCAQVNGSCALGDVGPGGGNVFYINLSGFSCGPTLNLTCRYLEAAPKTWSGGSNDPQNIYADPAYQNTLIGATAQTNTIGSGYSNSLAIINQGNGTSTNAGAARNYSGGGKNDWYLGNIVEMQQLFANKSYVSTVNNSTIYATSYETNADKRHVVSMVDGGDWYGHSKYALADTRPIRAF